MEGTNGEEKEETVLEEREREEREGKWREQRREDTAVTEATPTARRRRKSSR